MPLTLTKATVAISELFEIKPAGAEEKLPSGWQKGFGRAEYGGSATGSAGAGLFPSSSAKPSGSAGAKPSGAVALSVPLFVVVLGAAVALVF